MRIQFQMWALLTVAAATAVAQDPPSRVARLSLLLGPVSFQPAGVTDWSGATLNYPLTTGDHLFTDQGAEAEIRIGPNAIRLAGQTNFGFLNLDDRTLQIRLTEGSVNLRIRDLGDQDVYEIDTPNGAVSLLRTGEYRIDTDPDRNATMVTVRGGEAEVTANGQSFPVRPQQTAYFTGDGLQQSVQQANPIDDFDRFIQDRDRREDQAPPPRYVSQQMVGYEDLDANGTWEAAGEYGPIWRPRVRVGWSPYHEGHWAWREPWGWTWIDDAPWGFAPFHYGRWAYVGGGWGWCPGPVLVARPVYAPALVAFVGGGGFSVGIGIGGGGGVGWFPLGPREIYAPAYRVSPAYVRNVNYTNVREIDNITINNIVVDRTVVNNVYVNRGAPGAFTAVSRQDFVSARPVQRAAFQVSPEQLRGAPVAGFSANIAPQRESVFGRSQVGNVARPREGVFNRAVIARTAPPPAPVPFAARQQAIQANQGRPLAPQELDSIRNRQGFTPQAQPQVRSAVSPNQGFGRGAAGTSQPAPAANGSFGRPLNTPQPDAPQPARNQGFGRQAQPQSEMPENRGNLRPQETRPPQPNAVTPMQNPQQSQGFGRPAQPQPAPQATPPEQTRPQDRFESRPPQAPQRNEPTPRNPATQENQGFGRPPQPQATPQPNSPVQARPQDRFDSRPLPAPQRDEAAPRPEAAPRNPAPRENRGFGRIAQPEAAQRTEMAPPTRPVERPAPQAAPPRAERPANAAPENRGFGRETAPAAREARPKEEKPKEEKPKEEKSKERR